MSIDEKWREVNKLMLLVRGDLELLVTGKDVSVFLQTRLTTNLNQLSRSTDSITPLAAHQPSAKRGIWAIRVKQLVQDCKTLRTEMEEYLKSKYRKDKEEQERKQLSERLLKNGPSKKIEDLESERASLSRSHNIIDNITSAGMAVFNVLGAQNDIMKNSQRKLWDIANKLGMSQRVVKSIHRRHTGDKVIVLSGMVITLIILFILWYYLL